MGRPKLYSVDGERHLRRTTKGRHRPNSVYYGDFTAHGVRYRPKLGPDLEVAKKLLAEIMLQKGYNRTHSHKGKKQAGPWRLSELQAKQLASYVSPLAENSLKKYKRADKIARVDLSDPWAHTITKAQVAEWLADRREFWGPATVNRDRTRLSQVLEYAVDREWLPKNPCKGIKRLKEPSGRVRYLLEHEEEMLKAVCEPWLWDMIRFAYLTGLRVSEQLALEWSQVVNDQIRLRDEQTKSQRVRYVPLEEPALEILARVPKRKKLVWPSPKGLLWDPNNFAEDFWRPARARSGIEDFVWHDLRHTFCSRLVMAGVDLYTVGELAGHSSPTVTKRYAHLAPGHLREAIRVLK